MEYIEYNIITTKVSFVYFHQVLLLGPQPQRRRHSSASVLPAARAPLPLACCRLDLLSAPPARGWRTDLSTFISAPECTLSMRRRQNVVQHSNNKLHHDGCPSRGINVSSDESRNELRDALASTSDQTILKDCIRL